VGRLAATEAVKQFGTRAANLTRDEEHAEAAMGRRQLETAKQIVAALGTMKGAAMKLGQVMYPPNIAMSSSASWQSSATRRPKSHSRTCRR
jgi:hypothetical protein